MQNDNITKKEPKKWAKPNVTPSTARIMKRIALDQNLYVYQLIDEVFKEKFPEYFKDTREQIKVQLT